MAAEDVQKADGEVVDEDDDDDDDAAKAGVGSGWRAARRVVAGHTEWHTQKHQ